MTVKELDKIKCYWSIKENVWKPAVRIGSTMTVCNSLIFLFGGYNRLALNDLAYLDAKKAQWNAVKVTKGKRP